MFEGLENKKYTKIELLQMKPLVLAFVGDCVYELYIRNFLISEKYRDVNDLHRKSVFFVKQKHRHTYCMSWRQNLQKMNRILFAEVEMRIRIRCRKMPMLQITDTQQPTRHLLDICTFRTTKRDWIIF